MNCNPYATHFEKIVIIMARKSVGLTDAKVKSLPSPSKGRKEYWDTQISGLNIRVSYTGSKIWYVWGRVKKVEGAKAFKAKIGSFPAYGVHGARNAARDVLNAADRGEHPAEKKLELLKLHQESLKQSEATSRTLERERFDNVAHLYIEDYAKPMKRTWKEDQRILKKDFLSVWQDRNINDIGTSEIADRLRVIETRAKGVSPTGKGFFAANNALAVLRKMYNWAISNGYAANTPINQGMKRGNQEVGIGNRKRDFTDDEIRRIWDACDALPLNAATAVKMLMLTGQRLGVIGGMKYSEIDREEMTWTIPADSVGRSKNKLEHRVPLTNSIVSLIDKLTVIDGADHVFCSNHRGDKALTIGSKYKTILNANCGFGDWTYQGLRGLVVTRMKRKPLRIDHDIVDLIENRLPDTVQRRHYDSNDYMDEKREALERWNGHILKIIEDTVDDAADNVVQILV